MAKVALVNVYEANYLGTRMLAAWLRHNGHDTHNFLFKHIFWVEQDRPQEQHVGYQMLQNTRLLFSGRDARPFSEKELNLLTEALDEYAPDVVGFSARSANNTLLPQLVPAMRRAAPAALLVAGGFGPTLDPEIYLDAGFDVVVRGDGEEALLELVNGYAELQKLWQVPNTSWKVGNECVNNPLGPQEKNIDRYPAPLYGDAFFSFIDDDLLKRNFDPTLREGIYSTFLGRGCIGKCTYCSGGQWVSQYKKTGHTAYRRRNRSIHAVMEELKGIQKDGYAQVYLLDEFFSMSTEKTKEFFLEYSSSIGLPFFIFLDYEKMLEHPDLFELVMNAGLDTTGIGVQTGSESFAKKFYHRYKLNSIYVEYANILFFNNIYSSIHVIGGNCYEGDAELEETFALIKELPFSISDPKKNFVANIRLKPHPHTPITLSAPRVVSDPMPASEWYYRAMLLECRRILDDDEFAELRSTRRFHDDPVGFKKFYDATLLNRQRAYFASQLATLNGKDARDLVFYGCGELYRLNRKFFADLSPKVLLVDKKYLPAMPQTLDGIPVVAAEDFMQDSPDVSVLIFSQWATRMQRKLVRSWGMENQHILTCTSILTPQQ